jgi:2-aminoadipate transaminase
MPSGVDSSHLLDSALRQNVAFVPGEPFFPNGDKGSHMRLNFSHSQPEQIREGIRRLSIAVAHELEHQAEAVMLRTAGSAWRAGGC